MSLPQGRHITRNRERLSCKECRRRKLKCDRALPCSCCVRRGDEASCTYQRLPGAPEHGQQQRVQTEARLQQLEQLVRQLASQPGGGSSSSELPSMPRSSNGTDSMGLPQGGGGSIVNGTELAPDMGYKGATHWSAMLEDIRELRFSMPKGAAAVSLDDASDDEDDSGIGLIFGTATPATLDVILARYLPPRHEADRLTSAYFRARTVAAPFMHASQFRRLYAEFWKSPHDAPPLWISLLFSICHISVNTLKLGRRNTPDDKKFSIAAAHCLALGQYFRPKRFAVESLLLFGQAQCLTSVEISQDMGSIFGVLIRLATRMGYHREPDMFRFSPFEREMRRRAWSMCMQLDLIVSFHLGLPSGAQYSSWDVKTPRNLLDSDFDETSLELPWARPDSEITPITLYVTKHKIMTVFDKILRHTLAATSDESEVMTLDAEMRAVFAALPQNLHTRPMSESVVDPAILIVTRICVSFLYHKCLCILHRPYVTRYRTESIAVCYESATTLIRGIVDAYPEFLPSGQLETEGWFLSSITWHDYLFGVVALCMVVCATSQNIAGPVIDLPVTLALLEKARSLCSEQKFRNNKDSARVCRLLDAIILRFGDQQHAPPLQGADCVSDAQLLPQMQEDIHINAEDPWFYDETLAGLNVDSSWEYLERFMDFNNGNTMPES